MSNKNNQETIVNHLKTYGFIYQSSEIYNGLSNSWDFGPLGSITKNNLKNLWLQDFVFSQKNMELIDSCIILNPLVWKASGHIDNFSDPLIDCKSCKSRYRADKLIEENSSESINEQTETSTLEKIISDNNISCPKCKKNDWTNIRKFNLMFDTSIGVVDDSKDKVYLRPETAQGIFINFKNVLRTQRNKIPFGIAQIGKSFRNEITPGNFIFRTREFEQMEIEFFVSPSDDCKYFEFFENKIYNFLTKILGLKESNIKKVDYPKEELAHYSSKTIDYFYNFPHGEAELWGLANRGDFDLKQHQLVSNKSLDYLDDTTKEKYLPHIIEPSVGVERLLYAIYVDSYCEEILEDGNTRVVMKLDQKIAPYKVAVLPLTNKLTELAQSVYSQLLNKNILCTYDSSGSIGKRYRRQDAIGTPYCVTIDFNSLEDNVVTVRERDSMIQKRINISELSLENINKLFDK